MATQEQKNILSKNLRNYLMEKGITQTELATILSYPEMTVSNWVNAKYYPRIDKIQEMADFFGINKSDLIENKKDQKPINTNIIQLKKEEKEILKPFNKLNQEGKSKAIEYTWDLVDSNKYIETETIEAIGGAAAGNGFGYLDTITLEKSITTKERPDYDVIIPVEGDSMEPKIPNGALAFVRVQTNYDNGQIYVVDADEKVYIKQVYFENDKIILRSINKNYDDIIIQDSEAFRVIGQVVDWE